MSGWTPVRSLVSLSIPLAEVPFLHLWAQRPQTTHPRPPAGSGGVGRSLESPWVSVPKFCRVATPWLPPWALSVLGGTMGTGQHLFTACPTYPTGQCPRGQGLAGCLWVLGWSLSWGLSTVCVSFCTPVLTPAALCVLGSWVRCRASGVWRTH